MAFDKEKIKEGIRDTMIKIGQDGKFVSVIKFDGENNDVLVWKHPSEDFVLGSQLIVHESQEALFFRDGEALDLFTAGRHTLKTGNIPLLGKFITKIADIEGVFHSDVYFINLTTQMGIKWGTDSKVRLFDPMSGLHVELGACGEFSIRVTDSRTLIQKLVGTAGGLSHDAIVGNADTKGIFRSLIMTQVKSFLAQTIKENNISVLEIDARLLELSEALRVRINESLAEYGLEMPEFFVSRVLTPDDDPNFRKMKEQFAAEYLLVREENIKKREAEAAAERKAVEAETESRMKVIGAKGDAEALLIKKQAEAEAYRLQAEAEAREMHMKGYTYQQETSRQVGLEAMKNGITGGENGGGVMGDVASMSMTLGMMGTMIDMTKDAMAPLTDKEFVNSGTPANVDNGANTSPAADTWDCSCGKTGITSKFCPECGAKKPEKLNWTCPSCGKTGITSKFCPECGTKKPEELNWTCPNCGKTEIKSKFCPECGTKKAD